MGLSMFRKNQERAIRTLQRDAYRDKNSPEYTLVHQCFAEMFGVTLCVIFGVAANAASVLTNYHNGALWDVCVIWGFGTTLAILATGSVSGAHLNPAVSLAFAIFRPESFPWSKLIPYWLAQYVGGMIGGGFNLMIWGDLYRHYEKVRGIIRGTPASAVTASTFGGVFPNPGFADMFPGKTLSPLFALLVEAWGTGVLMFIILACTDPRQKLVKSKEMVPFYLGFTVAVILTLCVPFTTSPINPARDGGPRLVAAMAGWGRIAIPGLQNGFWIYQVGPHIGAIVGAFIYDLFINPGLSSD